MPPIFQRTDRSNKAPFPADEPGLFDRPDRAIAAMHALVEELEHEISFGLERLTERLRADGGTRFWTEREMREYARMVNNLLDRFGARILAPDGEPSRLGVKASNRPSGRYALFNYQPRRGGAPCCRRALPENLTLCAGPR